MPYEACDLSMIIAAFKKGNHTLSKRTLGQLLMEYALAMRFVQRVGIQPQDLKEANVFLDWNGHLKVGGSMAERSEGCIEANRGLQLGDYED